MAHEIHDDGIEELFSMEVVPEPETPSQAALRHINHLSGCGHDVSVLRTRILEYLRNHGGVGEWHSFFDVCDSTFAWKQFGKRVVDPLVLLMVADGSIEVDKWPGPQQLRLRTTKS